MKKIISISALMIGTFSWGQSIEQTQYAAYLKASKTLWEKSIDEAKKKYGEDSFETAIAMYGLLNNTMATQDEDTFDDYKDETIDLLEELIDENPDWGEPRAVLSSTYGLVMAYSPMKGMFLGMKSSSLMEEAVRLQPESPLVQKLHGGSKLYTPEMFGGDPEIAIEAFSRAIEIYEKESVEENWLYLDTMMGLSMAYRKTDQNEKAKEILEKAVTIEPQYYWAKSVLEKINKS